MTKQQTTVPQPSHTDPFSRKYKIVAKIGEGSYSEVLKCKNRESGSVYACKRLKHCYRSWNQVNDIPEIVTLRKLARHPNILQMVEIHFDPTAGRVSLVFELMDMNLYELIKDRKRLLPESRVRVMMFQLMRALRHLHKHGIFHRDVKPENILLRNDLLKLGDLGSVRGLYSRPPYTEYISTRWYRSPECLLTCGFYSFKMDVWAAGCVFYEILTLRPLFPGSSELDQINRIHNVLGPPPSKILQKFSKHAEIERDYSRHSSKQARLDTIKRVLSDMKNANFDWYFTGKEPKGVNTLLPTHVTSEAKDLLILLLQYDPDARPSSHRALQHAYFKDLREQAQRAAREKAPAQNGPIVTIVGDEGNAEVAADDNANPVDLATLGDAKLKIRAQHNKPSSEIKELKENKKTIQQESKILFDSPSSYLKEAGETFSREPQHPDMKSISINSSFNSTESEDRAKARHLENLRVSGDGATSFPYQKIFLHDKNDSYEPSNKSTYSAATLEEKRKQSSSLIRRRLSSKIEIERKKSVTSISQDPVVLLPGGRNFPLDFIDKAALTPDVLARINENRRIAQMQPIAKSELKKRETTDDVKQGSKVEAQQIRLQKSPRSPTEFSPRNFQYERNPQKPLKADHSQVFSLKDHENTMTDKPILRYTHSVTNKQVKEVLASLPNKKKLIPSKPPEKDADEKYKSSNEARNHSRNQLVKNLSALRTKYEAESKNHFSRTLDKSMSTELNGKNSTILRKTDIPSNKTSFTSAAQLKKEQQYQREPSSDRTSEVTSKRQSHSSFQNSSEKALIQAYDSAVEERLTGSNSHHIRESPRHGVKTDRYDKGVIHRYELNRVPDWRTRDERRSPLSERHAHSERKQRDFNGRERDPLQRHLYEYQYSMASRKSSILDNGGFANSNSKSDGHKTERNYDSSAVSSSSPTSIRRAVENRRNVELATTDTDGEGDTYLQQHRRLEGSRRKKRSRHHNRTDSLKSERSRDESKNKSTFSPRLLLQQRKSNYDDREPPTVDKRMPDTMSTTTAKYSNSSSIANKQVREILAEMRKRRDLLEEKVIKDPSLMSWAKSTELSKITSKVSEYAVKNSSKTTSVKDEVRDPYSVYRATHNRRSYPTKKQNAASVVELGAAAGANAEKLLQRRRPEDNNYVSSNRIKLARQESIPKYADSEVKVKSTLDRHKNHQSTTGAGSKAFPRNRYGKDVHK